MVLFSVFLINLKKTSQRSLYYEWCLAKDDVSPQQIRVS